MLNVYDLVTAAAAAVGAAWTIAKTLQRSYRKSVQSIIDKNITDVLSGQAEFAKRQAEHLDRQDNEIERIRWLIESRMPPQRPRPERRRT